MNGNRVASKISPVINTPDRRKYTQAVSVSVSRRLVHHLNGFPAKHELALTFAGGGRVRARRQRRRWKRRLFARRR
jgi:hypothetical protein